MALKCKNDLQKLPGESKNMGIAEKKGSILEQEWLGPWWWGLNQYALRMHHHGMACLTYASSWHGMSLLFARVCSPAQVLPSGTNSLAFRQPRLLPKNAEHAYVHIGPSWAAASCICGSSITRQHVQNIHVLSHEC